MPTRSTTGWRISSGASGFEVLALEGFGLFGFGEPGKKSEQDIIELSSKAIKEAGGADAVLISCGGLLTLGCAEPIEQRHGIPVVTSTQSAFWKAMRLAGDSGHVSGRGKMLAQSQAVPASRVHRFEKHIAGACGRRRLRGGGILVISAMK